MKKLYFVNSILIITLVILILTYGSKNFNNDIELTKLNLHSPILGKRVGKIQTYTGHKPIYPHPKKTINVIVIPYKKGFKIVFKPLDKHEGHFVCPLNSYVLQDNKKIPFNFIANNKFDYINIKTQKIHGYMEGNKVNDSCSIYTDTTSWIVFSDKVGFNPSKSYSIIIGEIEDKTHKLAKFDIYVAAKINNTYFSANYTSKY